MTKGKGSRHLPCERCGESLRIAPDGSTDHACWAVLEQKKELAKRRAKKVKIGWRCRCREWLPCDPALKFIDHRECEHFGGGKDAGKFLGPQPPCVGRIRYMHAGCGVWRTACQRAARRKIILVRRKR